MQKLEVLVILKFFKNSFWFYQIFQYKDKNGGKKKLEEQLVCFAMPNDFILT